MQDQFEMPTAKRQRVSDGAVARRPSQAPTNLTQSPNHQGAMAEPSPVQFRGNNTSQGHQSAESRRQSEILEPGAAAPSPVMSKPRRVRTGCLTCRNRHLKCDEAMPICLNCRKSNRKCERGVRLNFIDLKVEQPPYLLPPVDWKGKRPRFFREGIWLSHNASACAAAFIWYSISVCTMLMVSNSPISRRVSPNCL